MKNDSVDDEFEEISFCGKGGDFDELVLMASAEKTFFFQARRVGGLDGREDDGRATCTFFDNLFDDLLGRRGAEGATCFWVVRGTICGEENTEVIVDFGGGGESGSGGAAGVVLLDGESRGKAFDGIDGGSGETFEVKAGVGGEAFEIAPLPFGIDGIESEGGFS